MTSEGERTTIPAGVVAPILVDEMRWEEARSGLLLLTVRSEHVEHHKGQISFPGGVKDDTDVSLEATARREFAEELGVNASDLVIRAQLPSFPTFSSPFEVYPFVGLWPKKKGFSPNPGEISRLLEVPVEYLLDSSNSKIESIQRGSVSYKLKSYYFEGHRIWGATAKIITELLELLQKTE